MPHALFKLWSCFYGSTRHDGLHTSNPLVAIQYDEAMRTACNCAAEQPSSLPTADASGSVISAQHAEPQPSTVIPAYVTRHLPGNDAIALDENAGNGSDDTGISISTCDDEEGILAYASEPPTSAQRVLEVLDPPVDRNMVLSGRAPAAMQACETIELAIDFKLEPMAHVDLQSPGASVPPLLSHGPSEQPSSQQAVHTSPTNSGRLFNLRRQTGVGLIMELCQQYSGVSLTHAPSMQLVSAQSCGVAASPSGMGVSSMLRPALSASSTGVSHMAALCRPGTLLQHGCGCTAGPPAEVENGDNTFAPSAFNAASQGASTFARNARMPCLGLEALSEAPPLDGFPLEAQHYARACNSAGQVPSCEQQQRQHELLLLLMQQRQATASAPVIRTHSALGSDTVDVSQLGWRGGLNRADSSGVLHRNCSGASLPGLCPSAVSGTQRGGRVIHRMGSAKSRDPFSSSLTSELGAVASSTLCPYGDPAGMDLAGLIRTPRGSSGCRSRTTATALRAPSLPESPAAAITPANREGGGGQLQAPCICARAYTAGQVSAGCSTQFSCVCSDCRCPMDDASAPLVKGPPSFLAHVPSNNNGKVTLPMQSMQTPSTTLSSVPAMPLQCVSLEMVASQLHGLAFLGSGAGGEVYRSSWRGVPAAVKFSVTQVMDTLTRSAHEAVLSKVIAHPHLVQTFFVGVVKLEQHDFEVERPGGDLDAEALLGEVMGDALPTASPPSTAAAAGRGNPFSLTNFFTAGEVAGVEGYSRPRRSEMLFNSQDGFGDPDPDRQLDPGGPPSRQTWTSLLSCLQAKPGSYLTVIVMELCDRGGLDTAISRGAFNIRPVQPPPPPPTPPTPTTAPSRFSTTLANLGTPLPPAPAAPSVPSTASPAPAAPAAAPAAATAPAGDATPPSQEGQGLPPLKIQPPGPRSSHRALPCPLSPASPWGAGGSGALGAGSAADTPTSTSTPTRPQGSRAARGPSAPRIALRALLRTAREIALAMHHMHSDGLVHGDLKPGNVLLKSSRTDRRGFIAKVSDFGMSRVLPAAAGTGGPHTIHMTQFEGTPSYMAPEAMEGRLMPASDVWSFGMLLYHITTGDGPFADMHHAQIIYSVQTNQVQLDWPDYTPPYLRALAERCINPDPLQRPSFTVISKVITKIEQRVREVKRVEDKQRVASLGGAPPALTLAGPGAVTQ